MMNGGSQLEFWESEAAYENYLSNEQDRRDNADDDDEDDAEWDGWPEPDPFDLEN